MLKFISEAQEKIATKCKKHLAGILALFRRTANANKHASSFHADLPEEQITEHYTDSTEHSITSYGGKRGKRKKVSASTRIAAQNIKHFHALVAMQKGLDTRSKIVEGNYNQCHVERLKQQVANQDNKQSHEAFMH